MKPLLYSFGIPHYHKSGIGKPSHDCTNFKFGIEERPSYILSGNEVESFMII
jgi:hypothetical protein